METIGASPLVWLRFDEDGQLIDPTAPTALDQALSNEAVTDLVVLAHGWQNDLADARLLYGTLWEHAAEQLSALGRDPARIVVVGVLWPSKKYDADYDGAAATDAKLQTGGTLALDGADLASGDLPEDVFRAKLEQMGVVAAAASTKLVAAATAAAESGDPQVVFAFFDAARALLGLDQPSDIELAADARLFDRTRTIDGADTMLSALAMPFSIEMKADPGTALGLRDAVRSTYQGGRSAVLWALNKLTYYTMKARAGTVGASLAQVLAGVAPGRPLRLHLAGHSFGGRLVTAAAATLPEGSDVELVSLTLLQAAFSQNGLSKSVGPFAAALERPTGPIVVTHTHNDLACTVAYPLASRVVGDTTQALGDSDDPFGAMGANGPQRLAADALVMVSAPGFALQPRKVNLVRADGFIVKTDASDAHNNVSNATCGALLAAAVAADRND